MVRQRKAIDRLADVHKRKIQRVVRSLLPNLITVVMVMIVLFFIVIRLGEIIPSGPAADLSRVSFPLSVFPQQYDPDPLSASRMDRDRLIANTQGVDR